MTAAPAPAAHPRAVTFVLVTVFLDMMGFGLIMPVLPGLIEQVGRIDLAQAAVIGAWMFFVFAAGQFLFSPLVGNLSDRFGRRPLLLIAVAGLMVDYLFHAFAPSIFWLFVGRAIAGICGSSWVIANAFIADVTPPQDRGRAFGLVGAAFGVGFVAGPAIGGLLGEFGPRVPFFVAAGLSAVNLAFGWFVLPETLRPENRRPFDWRRANPFGTFRIFASYPTVLPLCWILGLYMAFSSVYPAIWAFWGIAKFGWSPLMVGATLAAFGLVTALFQGALAGPAVARFGERNTALIGLVAGTVVALGYGLAPGLAVVLILLVVHGPEGFVHPMLTAMMSQQVPEDAQGELQGGISAIMNVAMLVGTLFFGQVFGVFMAEGRAWQSPDVGFFIAAAGLLGVTALFLWQGRRR